jgi:hypothetical protein
MIHIPTTILVDKMKYIYVLVTSPILINIYYNENIATFEPAAAAVVNSLSSVKV